MRARLSVTMLLVVITTGCVSQGHQQGSSTKGKIEVLPLYTGAIPGAIKTENLEYTRDSKHPDSFIMDITHPTITAYFPDPAIANGTAVIILPGGGYSGVSIVKEGYQVAERLNQLGVTAFVLKYRMPMSQSMVDKSTGPLQDAQQAIHLVRSNNKQWHLNPNKIGIMGFSAGGHLAASAAVHFTHSVTSELAQHNLRPDFQILLYPVISFATDITHKGSRDKLIGPELTPQQVEYFSNELQVSNNAPPAFIVHAGDDNAVPVENSLVYYQALQQHQVSAQLLIIPSGGHGFGTRNQYDWFADLKGWMANMTLLQKAQ
jgi:acetyl esterase/lipase